MGSAENKRSVIVGIFVFIAIIIFVAAILTLGGQQKRFVQTVKVRAIFENVEGLKTGNNVWFSGVKIGTVKSITIAGQSQVEVELTIEEAAQKFIHKDAKARLASESLIGNQIIEILGGTPTAPQIQNGDLLQTEAGLNTDDMMATLQENNKNLQAITGDFKQLSAGLVNGKGTVGALLTDSTMATNFRTILAGLEKTSVNTARASAALSQFTAKMNTKDGLANQLLTDTAVFNQLQSSVAQLKQATTAASDITSNLKTTSAKLNSTDNAMGVLLNDEKFAGQLQRTMGNLETSTKKLDENMEAIKSNFLLKGYFKRQAVRDAKKAEKADTTNRK
ncbi:MlaD family protein [Pontibacter vulgaris]|uniref:MlaD family protein n=1 Tax=Pontibacter vulgaris TaxID=2905679 RepID=UPI001FA6BB9B|nr:MlaD family protein [Pontibacter vulgaris]